MPPKKAGTAAKKTGTASSHPPYLDMIKEAVINLKERSGSSRQAIKKYVQANNNLAGVSDAAFTTQLNKALQKGSDSGVFLRPKGPSGPVKLGAGKTGDSKPAAAKKAPGAKKSTTTKTATTKKAPAAKKTAATKAKTTKAKAPAKKATASKSKANTSKVRKTPAAAPAVEEKPPVVLGKTKSGRVTKSKAPVSVAKTIAPKKAGVRKAPAKKATPKK